jgi:hypothetical protein
VMWTSEQRGVGPKIGDGSQTAADGVQEEGLYSRNVDPYKSQECW